MIYRRALNTVFSVMVGLVAIVVGVVLCWLLSVISYKGLSVISLDFLMNPSTSFGASGGISYQIGGSIILILTAAVLCLPLSLGTAIYLSEYCKSPVSKKINMLLLYGLNGVPSIVFGIFGLIVFVNGFAIGVSWFVGGIVLALMIIPTVTIASYQSLQRIPTIYRESSEALGITKWQSIKKILLPQAFGGTLTGLLIGLARAIGETAPIMFIATAFSGVTFPTSIYEPVASLPTHILALAQQATNPKALANAWGSSFVLIGFVVLFSLLAMVVRQKFKIKLL